MGTGSGNVDQLKSTTLKKVNKVKIHARIDGRKIFRIQFNVNSDKMNNNETYNESLEDILDQTTLELELSGNEPVSQDPSEDEPQIQNPENQGTDSSTERIHYVFNTVEGNRYIVQGTSNRSVEIITLDQVGDLATGDESETESIESIRANPDPTPQGVREINVPNESTNNPDETIELTADNAEIQDVDLENANLQAWMRRSKSQKKFHSEEYLRVLQRGRANRKMILNCMREPGRVILNRIPIGSEELAEECEADNAVVRLDRNEIPEWNREQQKQKSNNNDQKRDDSESDTENESKHEEPEADIGTLKERSDSDTESDGDIKFVGAILKSASRYGGALDDAGEERKESKDAN